VYRHKEAWAVEKTAPKESELQDSEVAATASEKVSTQAKTPEAKRVYASSPQREVTGSATEDEILIVVSKLKKYISDKSDMSTSADVMNKLSTHLRELCLKAIKNAENSGRKTVMARDFLV
jgi:histone H3/H4